MKENDDDAEEADAEDAAEDAPQECPAAYLRAQGSHRHAADGAG